MIGVGIDEASPDWPYQQVAARIRERIRAGELGPRLPSYMDLAHQLEVSPMTVQRAIKVLRDEGLVVSIPGRGTFVKGALPSVIRRRNVPYVYPPPASAQVSRHFHDMSHISRPGGADLRICALTWENTTHH